MSVFELQKEKIFFFIFLDFHMSALSMYRSENIKNVQINDLKIKPGVPGWLSLLGDQLLISTQVMISRFMG